MLRLGALLVLSLTALPVSAQDEDEGEAEETPPPRLETLEARALFELGQRQYAEGRFAEAGVTFERAHELDPRPALLYDAYVAHRDAGQLERAEAALAAFLAHPDAEGDRAHLRARLASLRERLHATQPVVERARPFWPWLAVGLGVAIAAGGIGPAVVADERLAELDGACPNGTCPPGFDLAPRRDEIASLALAADLMFAGGAALALLGVVLALALDDDERATLRAGRLAVRF